MLLNVQSSFLEKHCLQTLTLVLIWRKSAHVDSLITKLFVTRKIPIWCYCSLKPSIKHFVYSESVLQRNVLLTTVEYLRPTVISCICFPISIRNIKAFLLLKPSCNHNSGIIHISNNIVQISVHIISDITATHLVFHLSLQRKDNYCSEDAMIGLSEVSRRNTDSFNTIFISSLITWNFVMQSVKPCTHHGEHSDFPSSC